MKPDPSHTCPACGHTASLFFLTRDYNRRMSAEAFAYFRCSACRYIFLSPVPSNLGAYYPKAYYDIPKTTQDLTLAAELTQQWKLETVTRFATRGRLLEIGPAYGLFSFLAKRAGFDVTAIEMDKDCCAFLRDTVGITVVEGGSDTVAELQKLPTFDVIVLWQVIEHLADPWAFLHEAARHLAPDGVLVVDTPNPDAFQFAVLGRYWTHIDAPRHVALLPARTLIGKMRAEGLTCVDMTAANEGSNGYNGFGWAFSFQNLVAQTGLGTLANLFGRTLSKLLIPIERSGGRGSTYTAVFRNVKAIS